MASEHILIIRLKSIGDVMLTLPAVHALRDNFPAAKITYLTSRENAVLIQGFKDVDEVLTIDRKILRASNPAGAISEIWNLVRRLRSGKFSLVVDFQGYGETAWMARLTGAPQRWGSLYSSSRKWAYTRGIPRDDDLQVIDFYLSLLQQCGLKIGPPRNDFVVPPEPLAAARKFFAEQRLDPARPVLFIHAFTSSPFKNWPLDRYLAVATHFRANGIQIIFGGGPGDVTVLQPAGAAGFVVAAGVPMLVSAGLMQFSTVVLGGATGPLHIAMGLKKRVVMLVGKERRETGLPFQHSDWVIYSRSGIDLSTITVETVVDVCADALTAHAPEKVVAKPL